jgi:glycosyltransferase involved in cell wall biosynthesis
MSAESKIRVSYILTTKNRARFLDTALAGLTELVEDRDEVIVVDGASTDDTPDVVERHRDLVDLFISEEDTGEAHGFNRGLLVARGEFIKLLTDDDVVFADGMRRVIELLEEHPEVDAVVCGGEQWTLDEGSGELELMGYHHLPEHTSLAEDPLQLFRTVQCGVGLVLRRRILARVGLLDSSYRAVDTELMFRMIDHGVNFKYLNVKLFRHNALPHSGMHIVEECHRDRLRVLARSGRWDALMNEHSFSPELIAQVLGLDRQTRGRSMMIATLELERLRRSRFGWLLSPLAGLIRIVGAVGRRITLPFRRRTELESLRTTEPDWDGAFR